MSTQAKPINTTLALYISGKSSGIVFFRKLTTVLSLSCAFIACPQLLLGQTLAELNTLFFDPVYLDDPDNILLTSADRNPSLDSIPVPMPGDTNQPDFSSAELLENIRNYESSINSLVEKGGTFEPGLAQEYLSISTLYQQTGDYENAGKALENAMHIHRVNQGLYTLEQTDAVRKLIANSKATRQFGEADKYHQYLYYLISRNLEPGSEELNKATLEWADWNLEAFRRMVFNKEEGLAVSDNVGNFGASMLRRGELVAFEDVNFGEILFTPRASLINSQSSSTIQTYTAAQLIDPRLKIADELFDRLIENGSNETEVLQRKANITFLYKTQLETILNRNTVGSSLMSNSGKALRSISIMRRGYSENRELLMTRAIAMEAENYLDAAQLYLDIADWDLSFDRLQRAREAYSKARDILLENDFTPQEIDNFLSPKPALFIPRFAAYENTRSFQDIPENMDIPYVGYIDVSFDKRKNGELRNIRIENTSENTSQRIRDKLRDLLRSVTVRPAFIDGESEEQKNINVRYYYSY